MFEPEENSRSWKSHMSSSSWHHAWRTWQLPYPDKYINKHCFIFHIISHGLTFWNTRLKSSNKRALLEKIMPFCDLCKSCVTSNSCVTSDSLLRLARRSKLSKKPETSHLLTYRVALISPDSNVWDFRCFFTIRKKVPAKKIIPAKIYSIVEIRIQIVWVVSRVKNVLCCLSVRSDYCFV